MNALYLHVRVLARRSGYVSGYAGNVRVLSVLCIERYFMVEMFVTRKTLEDIQQIIFYNKNYCDKKYIKEYTADPFYDENLSDKRHVFEKSTLEDSKYAGLTCRRRDPGTRGTIKIATPTAAPRAHPQHTLGHRACAHLRG